MSTDPFASAPAEDEAQVEAPAESVFDAPPADAPKKAAPKKAAAKSVSTDEGKVTVTLKGGSGFDAPWIVIHANSVEEADESFDSNLASLMAKVQKAGQHFVSLAPDKPKSAPSGGGSSAPRGAVEAPAGTPAAPGPDWTYKTGVGKTGKTWKAWMPPRGSDASPVWL